MVTTRRGRTTAVTPMNPPEAKGKVSAEKAGKIDASNGSYAAAEDVPQQQRASKKRSAKATEKAADADVPKRQRKVSKNTAEADLQVKESKSAPIEEESAVPEADTITAAAAMEPLAGAETDVTAEDLAPTAPAAEQAEVRKPDVSNTSEMPVSEAVKVIGGTQAGSAPVREAPTASKALDAVPVGPDPAAAGTAADDMPQDGDYFLDATLADSMLGNEECKPAEATGTTNATNTGFLAPPAALTGTGIDDDQTGMAADLGAAAPTDMPTGVHADKTAVAHTIEITGPSDTMHEAISTAPTTVDSHDSHFGAAAVQDAADMPAVYGGDNA